MWHLSCHMDLIPGWPLACRHLTECDCRLGPLNSTCGCATALDAAQLAVTPGCLSLTAIASMYVVAKVSPAPLVSLTSVCSQHVGL